MKISDKRAAGISIDCRKFLSVEFLNLVFLVFTLVFSYVIVFKLCCTIQIITLACQHPGSFRQCVYLYLKLADSPDLL